MNLPELPKIERQNSPELNSNQSIHNNGVPPFAVGILAAFVILLFFVVFTAQREVGHVAAEV
ncbi:MAG: hypothetical protein IIB77_14735, partial [Proteobacteria bacterium]|nr:hypothetical protein [Pseudomonadota bacterium]